MKLLSFLWALSYINAIVVHPLPESVSRGSPVADEGRTIENVIKKLTKKLIHSQNKRSTEYQPKVMFPPVTWKMKKGLFSSFIHLNFHGGHLQSTIRKKLSFPDDNGFVTMNVLEVLLDLWNFNVRFPMDVYVDAIGGIMDHQDKNSPAYLPKFNFWTQRMVKTSQNTTGYNSHPTNIAVPLKMYKSFNRLINFAAKALLLPEDVQEVISVANDFSTIGGSIFAIPPDADDTGCMLGVAAKLMKMIQTESKLRDAASVYFSQVTDPYNEAFDSYVKYAYRPYSNNVDESVIDPRTYHWIRGFLHERFGKVDLITTWFQKISEIPAQEEYQKMPFSVNNVDGSVLVNSLYGMVSTLMAQPWKYISKVTPSLVKLMDDSFALVEYIVTNNLLATHSASILLYYPSRYAFYYFVSRLNNLIDSGLPFSHTAMSNVLSNAKNTLIIAMRSSGTEQLLQLKKDDNSKGTTYWDDFLGNGDVIPKYEDRVFSTAMAFNALINTWTEIVHSGNDIQQIKYIRGVPETVVNTIERAAKFLISSEADNLPQENAFFSASVKDQSSLPFFGVTNYRKSVDGTKSLECTDDLYQGVHYVFGVKGLMSESEYDKQSRVGCFNMSTANPDVDYNSPDAVFPYWSAPSYTHSVRLLAIVRYRSLINVE